MIGFVDSTSMLGQHYLAHQAESVFYREARFYSVLEVEKLLADTGFVDFVWVQTLSKPLDILQEIDLDQTRTSFFRECRFGNFVRKSMHPVLWVSKRRNTSTQSKNESQLSERINCGPSRIF